MFETTGHATMNHPISKLHVSDVYELSDDYYQLERDLLDGCSMIVFMDGGYTASMSAVRCPSWNHTYYNIEYTDGAKNCIRDDEFLSNLHYWKLRYIPRRIKSVTVNQELKNTHEPSSPIRSHNCERQV